MMISLNKLISTDIMEELAKLHSDRPPAQEVIGCIDKSSHSKAFGQYYSIQNGNISQLFSVNPTILKVV